MLVNSQTIQWVAEIRHMKAVTMRSFFLLRDIIAEPRPRIGAKELLPICTQCPVTR
jgi:hypothetical protein